MWINRVLLQSARRSPALRTASSFSTELRGLPQYQVFGEDCMLSLKMILPVFRVLRNQQTMVVDNRGKGKILLEWTPRLAEGSMDRERQIRFALSPEEVALIIDQLPTGEVELVRRPNQDEAVSYQNTEKVLRLVPKPGGIVLFQVGWEQDGVPSVQQQQHQRPLEVNVQLGEFHVIKELMRTSIPTLVGWSTMVEMALQRNVQAATRGEYYGGGNSNNHNSGFGHARDHDQVPF